MNLRDSLVEPIINALGLQKLSPDALFGLGRLAILAGCLGFIFTGNFGPAIFLTLLLLLSQPNQA